MDLGLSGKVALITGASKGLGFAIAEELAREGAHVAICARGKKDLEAAGEALKRSGATAIAVAADATRAEDAARMVEETVTRLGGVDILVNNAGGGDSLTLRTDITDAEWLAGMDTNFFSAVRVTREVIPHMRRRGGGRIINMSTVSAHTPIAGLADYNSAKAAMLAWSKTLSFELAPDNILVNSVAPACIHSPLWDRIADSMVGAAGSTREEVFRNFADQLIALKRYGVASEVSGLVAFLASSRASFITGSIFDVDGGLQKSR